MSRDQLKRLKLLESENTRLRRAVSDLTLDKMILTDGRRGGKLLSPSRRRRCIEHVREVLGVSERRACRTLGPTPINTAQDYRAVYQMKSV